MKLQEKIFELYAEKKFDLRLNRDIVLVVNGYTTDIKIQDLFKNNIKFIKNGVKGFSILSNMRVEDGFLVDGEKNKYSFYVSAQSANLLVSKITSPILQELDIVINEDEYWNKLVDGINQYKKQLKSEEISKVKEELSAPKTADKIEKNPEVVKEDSEIQNETPDDELKRLVNTDDLSSEGRVRLAFLLNNKEENNKHQVPKEASETQLEELIDSYLEGGYDYYNLEQYNLFLHSNKTPILFVGTEKAKYVTTNYDEKLDKATFTFSLNGKDIKLELEKDTISYPKATDDKSPKAELVTTDYAKASSVKNEKDLNDSQ